MYTVPTPRPQLHLPTYGHITQGTIFCCARAPRYNACHVHGLVITARCDVAQRKYPVLNYLPVVSLPDWLRHDGLDILIDDELSTQNGTMKSMLREANISPSLVSSVSLETIAEVHFRTDQGTRNQIRLAIRFREHITLIEEFNSIQETSNIDELFSWFCKIRPGQVKSLIQRLNRHAVLGHYFFETLSLGIIYENHKAGGL